MLRMKKPKAGPSVSRGLQESKQDRKEEWRSNRWGTPSLRSEPQVGRDTSGIPRLVWGGGRGACDLWHASI